MTTAQPANQRQPLTAVDVITPVFRVSYPYVFEPRPADKDNKAKYSVQMLFRVKPSQANPHEKVVSIVDLQKAAYAAAVEKWGADQKKWPAFSHNPFRKGTEGEYADKDGYGEGVIFVSANSDYKPGLVDQNTDVILDRNLFYPGCYARALLKAHGWEYMGKKGVSFWLQQVQLAADGEPLGGGSRAEDVFEPIPVPGAQAPAAGTPAGAPVGQPADGGMFGGLGS